MPDDDSELSRLDPEPAHCTLSNGLDVEVVRLRTRQFFRLLKILTHGAGPAVMQAGLDFNAPAEEFTQRLLMLVVMSIPDAENEAIVFLQSMCQPAGLNKAPDRKGKLSKAQEEQDTRKWEAFNKAMFNPELDDTLELITVVVQNEAPELQALGKKAAALLKVAGVERAEEPPTGEELAASSSEPSRPRSTSSATSTGGRTSTSTTSRSAGSASASRRRAPAASGSR